MDAKVRWFGSLSLAERMDVFCAFTELILTVNPKIAEQRDAELPEGHIRVLSAQ